MNIVLGKSGNKNLSVEIPALLVTRMLIQADSGGGKTWLMRVLAEQLFGKVQVIIIDPEGEFATLREKHGFVLAGKGGETPADIRSAALLAHRLLDIKASAICDIYEMKAQQRHTWVRLFLEAMIDAPKNLWHPCIVIVDEAHIFCPEKGKGESEASQAMIDLCTRGRKRGFCAIFATQRLSVLNKDASGMLLNRLIGPTFESGNVERAIKELNVAKDEVEKFKSEIKMLDPGHFYAFGRAVSRERVLFTVGAVHTTHPEVGSKHNVEPPPPPENIAKLLPKLADLPKAAEEKAKTEADLRKELRELKQQLRNQQNVTGIVKVDQQSIERAVAKATREVSGKFSAQITEAQKAITKQQRTFKLIAEAATQGATIEVPKFGPIGMPKVSVGEIKLQEKIIPSGGITGAVARTHASHPRPDSSSNGDISGPEQRILDAIAWFESIGITEPQQTAVAFLAGYTYGGGGFNNPRSALNTKGMVQYRRGNSIALTEAGRQVAKAPDTPLTQQELQSHVLEVLPGPEQRLLKVLLEVHPESISKDDLANRVGYAPGSGGFNNPCSRLRTFGLVEYPEKGKVIAKDFLFPE